MPEKKSQKPATKQDNKSKFVNQTKISPEKAMKTKLDKVPVNKKKNKVKK